MFSTFSISQPSSNKSRRSSRDSCVPAGQARAKRTLVPVACDYCRKNRIKCNNTKPCENCKTRKLTCSHDDTSETRGLLRQIQVLVSKVDELENRLQTVQDEASKSDIQTLSRSHSPRLDSLNSKTSLKQVSPQYSQPAVQPVSRTSQCALDLSSDRFAGFVDRLLERQGLSLSRSMNLVSSSSSTVLNAAEIRSYPGASRTNLPKNQEEFYIRLFWRKIHRILPVVDEDDFKAHYTTLWGPQGGQGIRLRSGLVDMVVALALQLDFDTRPENHHPDLDPAYTPSWTWLSAQSFYHSCSERLAQELESPTWQTLQCYILMVVFLRNEGRHNSAYQVLGLAIRVANVLGIDEDPSPNATVKELRLRDQMRDFLLTLDTQQLLESARPSGLNAYFLKRHLPIDPNNGCFWYYWSDLLIIAKTINANLSALASKNSIRLDDAGFPNDAALQFFGQALPVAAKPLATWAANVPPQFQLARTFPDVPFSTEASINLNADLPVWEVRQRLFLELSYHWINMSLFRWFINKSGIKSSPASDFSNFCRDHTLDHACAIVNILDHALNDTEAIHGWYNAHLIQWDAALSLISVILCWPDHHRTVIARSALAKCGTIFISLGTRFPCQAALAIQEVTNKLNGLHGSNSVSPSGSSNTHSLQPSMMDVLPTGHADMNQFVLSNDLTPSMDFDMDTNGLLPLLDSDQSQASSSDRDMWMSLHLDAY